MPSHWKFWIGLMIMFTVNGGRCFGRQATDKKLQHFRSFTSSFTHPPQFTQNGKAVKPSSTINEEELTTEFFRIDSKRKTFLETNPWIETQNITSYGSNYNVDLNDGNRFEAMEKTNVDWYENIINDRWLPSMPLNITMDDIEMNLPLMPDVFTHEFDHSQFIKETMLSMSQILNKIGLTSKCSIPSAENIHSAATEVVEHIFLNISRAQEVSWMDKNHPVGKHIRKFSENAPKIKKKCSSLNSQFIKNHFEQFVADMDEDLKKFLSKNLALLGGYLSTDGESKIERIFSIFYHVCSYIFGTKGQSTQQCAEDLTNSYTEVIEEENNQFGAIKKLIRYKRFTDMVEIEQSKLASESRSSKATIHDIEKSGSYGGPTYGDGGYGGDSYGGGYKEHNDPNIIVIPNEGNDFSYPLILKFLGILVIGTYVFLGILVAHTLLSLLLFGFGPAGLKGDRGPQGPKGMLGNKGIKGIKGMKGSDGEPGPAGPDGMVGDPGDDGEKGVKGDPGPPGDEGPKGNEGFKGIKGAKGEKGDKGADGEPGGARTNVGKRLNERKKREVGFTHWKSTLDLQDAPNLLNILYVKENRINQENKESSMSLIVTTINDFWREFKSPTGCLRCALFQFLDNQPDNSLDSYIAAGFAHVLGDTGSLQLLDQVRRAKKKMLSVRCRRRKTSCKLEYIDDK